jgi:hypothetical protein
VVDGKIVEIDAIADAERVQLIAAAVLSDVQFSTCQSRTLG